MRPHLLLPLPLLLLSACDRPQGAVATAAAAATPETPVITPTPERPVSAAPAANEPFRVPDAELVDLERRAAELDTLDAVARSEGELATVAPRELALRVEIAGTDPAIGKQLALEQRALVSGVDAHEHSTPGNAGLLRLCPRHALLSTQVTNQASGIEELACAVTGVTRAAVARRRVRRCGIRRACVARSFSSCRGVR